MPISTGLVVVPRRYLPVSVVTINALVDTNIIYPPMTLGGQPLNSPYTDGNGIGWIVNDLTGWDAADVRLTETPRGGTDGLFHEPGLYGGRLLIAKGAIVSIAGAQALMAAREQLHSAVNIMRGHVAPFVNNETPPKMCMVHRAPGYKDRPVGTAAVEFEIHLLADDPNKYDPASSSVMLTANTSVTITNVGSTGSFPLLTVQGPCLGFNVNNLTTGQYLAFGQALSSTDVFTVNLDRKSAMLNGVSAIASIISDPLQWWQLVPGANTIQFTTVGTGRLYVTYSSAWT